MSQFSSLLLISALHILPWSSTVLAIGSPLLPITTMRSQQAATNISATDLYSQIETLLQAAQQLSAQGQMSAALAQLSQATDLVQTLPSGEERGPLLKTIGDRLIELKAFDQARGIAQAMTYETLGINDLLRVDLEKALVRASLEAGQTTWAIALIEALRPEMRDQYWVIAIEVLTQQGELTTALEVLEQLADQGYFRYLAINAINRAYIGAEQFDAAQTFLQQQAEAFSDPLERAAGFNELALWAGRANQMDRAVAIATQVPAPYRASLLVELAKLYQAQGQIEPALALLGEAAKLPRPTDNWWGSFETLTKIAETYVALGQPAAAQQLLDSALETEAAPQGADQPIAEWVGAFAQIGAFDQAWQLLSRWPVANRYEAQFKLATVYTDQKQYEQAITLASQIPDGVLFPLPEYPDPKLELLNRIISETIQQKQFASAQRAAQIIQAPVNRVRAWVTIATAYQTQQQTQAAITQLDQALALANTIEKHGLFVDRHSYFEVPNADLLTSIAIGYQSVGQTDQAVAIAQSAIQSVHNFESNFQSSWFSFNFLEKIGKLGRDWQQPNLQQSAINEMERQIDRLAAENSSPETLIDPLTRLAKLAYEPGKETAEPLTHSLARLETIRQQATDPTQQLTVLHTLIDLYHLTEQPALASEAFEQALSLIAPLSSDLRDSHYQRLALTLAPKHDPNLSQLIGLLSSPSQQVDTFLRIAMQFAAENQTSQTLKAFEQAAELAQRSLSDHEQEAAMITVANHYSQGNRAPSATLSPQTPAEVALMVQLPQYASTPLVRAQLWINLLPSLPFPESQKAHTELTSTLTDITDAYARRDLLWQAMTEALSFQQFELARQIGQALDGEYRQTALAWVDMAR